MFQYLQIFYRPGLLIQEIVHQRKLIPLHFGSLFYSELCRVFLLLSTGLVDPETDAEGISGRFHSAKVIIGGILGLGVFYIFALALKTFGRWFGAKVESKEVRTALGIGIIPWTVSLFLIFFVSITLVDPRLILGNFFLFFFIGFIYGFTILLIALSKTLNIGFLKTFFCYF